MESLFGVSVGELKIIKNGSNVFDLEGEPGLSALLGGKAPHQLRTMITKSSGSGDYDVEFDEGQLRIFKKDEDGKRVEIETGSFKFPDDAGSSFFSDSGDVRIFSNENRVVEWLSKDGDEKGFRFEMHSPGQFGSTDARLRSAQSMLEATERMLGDLKDDAGSDAQKDLRDAEKQLEKALKSLKKAQEAVEKSDTP